MIPLTKETFVQILRKFADESEDVIVERDQVICHINDDNFVLKLKLNEDGVLYCQEIEPERCEKKARIWIEKRLAKFDDLARKILDVIEDDSHFISVPSRFNASDVQGNEYVDVERTTEALFEKLNSSSDWSTHVYYLLSDAGEGKTCIMQRLARMVAQKYLKGEVRFLFLPIGLDGRPFMRFDEVVIGVLAQTYRFRRFYFEAIMELARNGFLILGLDGFEEMTVEGQENKVISSLGNLLQQQATKVIAESSDGPSLASSGAMVISARRAFYEYALKAQGPLMDSIRDYQVDFSAFKLKPWGREQLLSLMEKWDIVQPEAGRIYQQLAERLGANHPILTWPVLACKLVEMMAEAMTTTANSCDDLIQSFSPDQEPQRVLQEFVAHLLKREASQKWILYSGARDKTFQQLLSTDEHEEMLEEIAEEMWLSSMEYIHEDSLQSIVELFCENKGKSPADTQKCKEKIIHHAMLVKGNGGHFFCHDAFRQYFLGRCLARTLTEKKRLSGATQLLTENVMSMPVVDTASYMLAISGMTFGEIKAVIDQLRHGYQRNTTMNQNVACLMACLWKRLQPDGIRFDNLYFSATATQKISFKNTIFSNCVFEDIAVPEGATFEGVEFVECSVAVLSLPPPRGCRISAVFDTASRPMKLSIAGPTEDAREEIYSPQEIVEKLSAYGCRTMESELSEKREDIPKEASPDERYFKAFDRLLRVFQRKTGASGAILKMKFHSQWSEWERDYLPRFLDEGLIHLAGWHGAGQDDRYLLAVSARRYEEARKNCHEDFSEFCRLMKRTE